MKNPDSSINRLTLDKEKVLTGGWCLFFFTGRMKGYEHFCEISTKKKSNQKKKGVNIRDNSSSYLQSINTFFIITISVFNLKMNTKIFAGIPYFFNSGIIYYQYLVEGW